MIKAKYLYFGILLGFYLNETNAQIYNAQFLGHIGGIAEEYPYAAVKDNKGNSYFAGSFTGNVDFNPDPVKMDQLKSGSGADIYVLKFDSEFKFLWARKIGGSGVEFCKSITLDKYGNPLICGSFSDICDFDPDPGKTNNRTALNNEDNFILKLDSMGSFQWVLQIGGRGTDAILDITTNKNDDILCTGLFGDSVDFDPGPGIEMRYSKGKSDVFILKLDKNGNFIWMKQMGSNEYEYGKSIKIDMSGNIYCIGEFVDLIDIDPGPDTFFLRGSRCFMVKLDFNGTFLWGKRLPTQLNWGYHSSTQNMFCIDNQGSFIGAGWFKDSFDFDLDKSNIKKVARLGDRAILHFKLDSTGKLSWLKSLGGKTDSSHIEPGSMCIDKNDNVCMSSRYQGPIDVYYLNDSARVVNTGFYDALMIVVNKNGVITTSFECKGFLKYGPITVISTFFNTNKQFDIYGMFGGYFSYLNDSSQIKTLVSKGNWDIFIERITICKRSFSSLKLSSCDSLVWNGKIYKSSGNYTEIIKNKEGCDSNVQLNIEIPSFANNTITKNKDTLYVGMSDPVAQYQWYDCDGDSILKGENKRAFIPKKDGKYAVITTIDNCVDTSVCYDYFLNEINLEAISPRQFLVYPNPNDGEFNIPFNTGIIEIQNIYGASLNSRVLGEGDQTMDFREYTPGLYILIYKNGDQVRVCKWIKN